MAYVRGLRTLAMVALFIAVGAFSANADNIKTVFVIARENHNWAQPGNNLSGGIKQLYLTPNAPSINSLVNGTSAISSQVSFATAYHNVLATPSGNNPH